MREAISGTYIFQIVVFFVLLFTAFMSLSINYSRAFKVSSEIANMVERNNGINDLSIEEIQTYLLDVGYRTTGNCNRDRDTGNEEDLGYEAYGLDAQLVSGDKGAFCVKRVEVINEGDTTGQFPVTVYYKIKVFFKLDLPILSSIFEFEIKSSTKQLNLPNDFELTR